MQGELNCGVRYFLFAGKVDWGFVSLMGEGGVDFKIFTEALYNLEVSSCRVIESGLEFFAAF